MSADILTLPTQGSFEPWVGEAAVAAHFGIAKRTVRAWRLAGMPSRLLNGRRRYRLSECESWAQDRGDAA